MKIVINRCFGGFSLSPKAVKRMAELQGKECYFFKDISYEKLEPITIEEAYKSMYWFAFNIPHPRKSKNNNDNYLDDRPEIRHDPILVKVVEELGKEASGKCAQLKVVEIPDGIKYEICDYNGLEHIAEKHRTWE